MNNTLYSYSCEVCAEPFYSSDGRLTHPRHLQCIPKDAPDHGDVVNHPKHYNTGKIEVIEFIEDKELSFHLGNAVKYISRAGKKNPGKFVEDLEKAIWYIERQIEIQKEVPRRPNDMHPVENYEYLDKGAGV